MVLGKCNRKETRDKKQEIRDKKQEPRSEIIETRLDAALGWQEVTPIGMLSLNSRLLFLASRKESNFSALVSCFLLLFPKLHTHRIDAIADASLVAGTIGKSVT